MKISTKLIIAALAVGCLLVVCFTKLTVRPGSNYSDTITIGVSDSDTLKIPLNDFNVLNFTNRSSIRLWVYYSTEDENTNAFEIRCDESAEHPYIEMVSSWKPYLRTEITESGQLNVWLDYLGQPEVHTEWGELYVSVFSPITICMPPSMLKSLNIEEGASIGTLLLKNMVQSEFVFNGCNEITFLNCNIDTLKYGSDDTLNNDGDNSNVTVLSYLSNLSFESSTINEMLFYNPCPEFVITTARSRIERIFATFTEDVVVKSWSLNITHADVGNFGWTSTSYGVGVQLVTGEPYNIDFAQ